MHLFLAEVMDKEPTATWLLSAGLVIAVLAWAAVRWTRWLLVFFEPVAVLTLVFLTSEIRDPHVGPAIVREAGWRYVVVGWIAGLLPAIGCLAGWFANVRKPKRSSSVDTLHSAERAAPTLQESFRATVEHIMHKSPDRTRDWKMADENGNVVLEIPKLDAQGFDVTVVADDQEVTVYSEFIAHKHFTSDGDHAAVSELAMGLVRDLLSPLMRLRVIEVRGKPSRGDFQVSQSGEWQTETLTGVIGLSMLGKRVEKFYVNRRLPARDITRQGATP